MSTAVRKRPLGIPRLDSTSHVISGRSLFLKEKEECPAAERAYERLIRLPMCFTG
jgi:hypothetical protein